jgi:hypothetical protein
VQVSPDHSRLAYAVDTVGGEKFTLHVLDLATGEELLTPTIEVSTTSVAVVLPYVFCFLMVVCAPVVSCDPVSGAYICHCGHLCCS